MSSMPMFGQFIGSTLSTKKGKEKLRHSNTASRRAMYMEYASNLGKGGPTPTPNAGRLASQTSGRTTRSYQTKGA